MTQDTQNIAVLTGDLIRSSDLTPDQQQQALDNLRATAIQIGGWPGVDAAFGLRGGDGWQLVLSRAERGLRAALTLRASLRSLGKAYDSRIAIANGADALPPDGNPNAAIGPVYVASGRLLETMKDEESLRWGAASLGAATLLADHISRDWTEAQARALAQQLPPGAPKRADIAKALGVSRQSVNRSLWSAGYPALSEALEMIETDTSLF